MRESWVGEVENNYRDGRLEMQIARYRGIRHSGLDCASLGFGFEVLWIYLCKRRGKGEVYSVC